MTAAELVRAAHDAGYESITPRQIERWHKADLLPRPLQHHMPGVRGSVARYPPRAVELLLALCRLRREHRNLDELRFWLWWHGYLAPSSLVRETIKGFLRFGGELRSLVERPDDPFDAAEAIAPRVLAGTRDPTLRAIRRRLKNAEDVLTCITAVAQFMFGGTPAWTDYKTDRDAGERPLQDIVFFGCGFQRAETDTIGDVGPLVPEDSAVMPAAFDTLQRGGFVGLQSIPILIDRATDDELNRARSTLRWIFENFLAVLDAIAVAYGADAFGLGAVRAIRAVPLKDVKLRALLLAGMLALQRAVPVENFEVVREAVEKAKRPSQGLLALSRALPQYRQYLGPGGAGKLALLTQPEREAVLSDLRAFIETHPEAQAAAEEAEGRPP